MSTKAYLLQECDNVKDLLEKTLRHDYGLEDSRDFFDECSVRLSFITDEIRAADENDLPTLHSRGRSLDQLAVLICRIERSSLGEYSWPFLHELKKISSAICRESTLHEVDAEQKVYVFAEGGLASYAIDTEPNRPTASRKRLLTIVFPKSLKNFVLLHPILGHELGHAIWRVSKHEHTLREQVFPHFRRRSGALKSVQTTAARLFSPDAPQEFRDYLTTIPHITKANVFQYFNWDAWTEEVLCDLIGLVTFGPCFVAAHCRLLYTIDPSGLILGEEHPPVAWRVNMILTGATLLGYDKLPNEANDRFAPTKRFWDYTKSFAKPDSWYDFLTTQQLRDALNGIKTLLDLHPPASYTIPHDELMDGLITKLAKLVPPVGHEIKNNSLHKNFNVDFRHIIYAGWIAEHHDPKPPFKRINQLCEHAIMQQQAIEITLRDAG